MSAGQASMRPFYLIGFLLLVAFDTAAQIGFKFAATSPVEWAMQFRERDDGIVPLSLDSL